MFKIRKYIAKISRRFSGEEPQRYGGAARTAKKERKKNTTTWKK